MHAVHFLQKNVSLHLLLWCNATKQLQYSGNSGIKQPVPSFSMSRPRNAFFELGKQAFFFHRKQHLPIIFQRVLARATAFLVVHLLLVIQRPDWKQATATKLFRYLKLLTFSVRKRFNCPRVYSRVRLRHSSPDAL